MSSNQPERFEFDEKALRSLSQEDHAFYDGLTTEAKRKLYKDCGRDDFFLMGKIEELRRAATQKPAPSPAADAPAFTVKATSEDPAARTEPAASRSDAPASGDGSAPEIGPDHPRVPAREDWLRYRDGLGWSVLPVKENKKPALKWEPYQDRKATDAEIDEWVRRGWYIAAVTGKISGFISVEYDGTEAPADFSTFPETAQQQTFGKAHGGGVHTLFSCPDHEVHNTVKQRGFDIRGDGGYIVVPPFIDGRRWLRKTALGGRRANLRRR